MILKQSNKDSGFSSNCCNLNVRTCSKSLKSLCQSKCFHFKLTIFGLATNFDSNCYQLVTKLNRMDPRQWLASQSFWCSQKSQISQKHVAAHTRLGEKCILLEIGPRWLGKRGHWGLRWFGGDQHGGCHRARWCWAWRWGRFLFFILFCISANSNSIVYILTYCSHFYQKHQTLSVADDIT